MVRDVLLKQDMDELYSDVDLSSLLNKIVEKIKNYLKSEEATIFLYNPIREELYFEIVSGDNINELKKIVLHKGEGIVGWVAEHNQSVIINDCAQDSRFSGRTDLKIKFKTRSIMGVPVFWDGKLLGVVEAINKKEGEYKDEDLEILEYFARFIAIPLHNAILFENLTREHSEKERLLELAKMISYSGNLDEVLSELKAIICGIIHPLEINVMVRTDEQTTMYNLMSETQSTPDDTYVIDTTVKENQAVFPLKSKKRRLGFLELKVKSRIPREIHSLIRGLAAFVAILIEKIEMQNHMIEKEKMEKELQIARSIQQSFLLNEPVKLKGVEAVYMNLPSSQVGGDYYDIIKLDDNQTIFTLNDIAGHGIPASLLMSTFRTNFVYQIKRTRDIVKTITALNDLLSTTTDAKQFVTSFTCLIDTENMKLSYVNGGHNPPFVIKKNKTIKLDKHSLAVGWFPDVSFNQEEELLEPGDLLVMYTDGIVEAEDPGGNQYTLERLITYMENHSSMAVEELKDVFIEDLKGHVKQSYFEDDITFLLIKLL